MRVNFYSSQDRPCSKSWSVGGENSKWEFAVGEPGGSAVRSETFNDKSYITFFCGFGGTCSGAEAAGLQCVIAIDNNDRDPRTGTERLPAIQTRQKNIGDGKGVVMSIADFDPKAEHAARICFASPPCKRFSTAAEGRDSDDIEQASLDENLKNLGIVAIEKAMLIPKLEYYVMENVEGLLRKPNRPYLDRMISLLLEHGCSVEFSVYDARDFGLCQSRRRLFMVASRSGKKDLLPRPPGLEPVKFEQIIDTDPIRISAAEWKDETYVTSRAKELDQCGSVKWIVKDLDAKKYQERALRFMDDCLPTVTCAWGGGATRKKVAILDNGLRHPTLLEGLRAQGYPDTWLANLSDLPAGLAWNMVGNAVPTPFARAFAEHLQLPDEARKANAQTPTEMFQAASHSSSLTAAID